MLDPIVNFFIRVFHWIGRGIGWIVAILLWPFMWAGRWYLQKGWILKVGVGVVIAAVAGLYAIFFWNTQVWRNFNPDYPTALLAPGDQKVAGEPVDPAAATGGASASPAADPTCKRSAIVDTAAALIDFNVNQNGWVPSMVAYKLGLFGLPWRYTPFLDNKAVFQLGINQVLRRTSAELVDTLGRVRGTSQIDNNLQEARTALAWDEEAWYIGFRGPTRPTPSVYRDAIQRLHAFNTALTQCRTTFDARADNLLLFLDRVAGDIGSTSDILRQRLDEFNAGWFDPRADDRFWFAYGQLYAYYGILAATRTDFAGIIAERNLTRAWTDMMDQLRLSLNMQPTIVSNGREASFLFPSHLATMGFYVLRVRSQIVEIRAILDR